MKPWLPPGMPQGLPQGLPGMPPGLPQGDVVALLPCGGTYKAGLYHLGEVTVHGTRSGRIPKPFTPAPPGKAVPEDLVNQAAFLVFDSKCHEALPAGVKSQFTLAAKRRASSAEIWLRLQGQEIPAARPSTPADDVLEPDGIVETGGDHP